MWSLGLAQGAFTHSKAKRNNNHTCPKPPLTSGLREHILMSPEWQYAAFTAVLGRRLHRADMRTHICS